MGGGKVILLERDTTVTKAGLLCILLLLIFSKDIETM